MQVFDADGGFLAKWGEWGSDGEFAFRWASAVFLTVGVAVDAAGNVYVTDSGNSRVQKFRLEGSSVTRTAVWGSGGTSDGQFSSPYGIALDAKDRVYVADSTDHRVQQFTAAGRYLGQWGRQGPGRGQLYAPLGLAVGSNGHVIVADHGNGRIQKFLLA
jgi:DNA-binding beta-propeller fold protein YncE